MLKHIGRGKKGPDELADLLLACHERIRHFAAVALALANTSDLGDHEVVEACAQVERYFTLALPLHVADEEQSILPRLQGAAQEVSEALATMHDQHLEHGPLLGAFLAALMSVRDAPRDVNERARLGQATTQLAHAFEDHLTLEEQVIIPAVRRLPAAVQADITRELRARRAL